MKRPYKSFLSDKFEEFDRHMEVTGNFGEGTRAKLHWFDSWLADKFPAATVILPEMLEWCNPRPSENGNSCNCRISIIRKFLCYASRHGWTTLTLKQNKIRVHTGFTPHFFTNTELKSFFEELDNYCINMRKSNHHDHRLNRIQLPVFYRLLFSSGMRTCEARWLHREDIDFSTGVVEIKKSKGASEHRIVLHESMLGMLAQYDEAMESLMPGRVMMFPTEKDTEHQKRWVSDHFRRIWRRVSSETARAYDLRSMYAVFNISRWQNHGFEISGNLLFLSRSMGHRELKNTLWYFHLTPMLADKLKHLSSEGFTNICPQLPELEKDEE